MYGIVISAFVKIYLKKIWNNNN